MVRARVSLESVQRKSESEKQSSRTGDLEQEKNDPEPVDKMKTFEEAFNGKRAVLVSKIDVTIDLLEKLRDKELLTKQQFQKLKADRDRKRTSEVVSTLLDMLEKVPVKRKRVNRLQLFCDILRDEGQPHIADIRTRPVTPQPANGVKAKKQNTQNDEAAFHGDSPSFTRVHMVSVTAVFVLLVSVGTYYYLTRATVNDNPSKEPPLLNIPKHLQQKLVSKSIPLVRQNSTTFTEHLAHSSPIPDLVDSYPREEISAHIRRIILNASLALKGTLRKVDVREVEKKVEAYKTFVRPILENCSSAWNPDTRKDIEDIENVQRKFVDSVLGPENKMTYRQKLEHLGLETLEVRRLRKILIHAYSIAFDLVKVDKEEFFYLTTDKTMDGHSHRLELLSRTDAKLFHFCATAVITWNKLPADKVDFNSIEAFEMSLTSDVLLTFCKSKLE